jgi:hypothetical protein
MQTRSLVTIALLLVIVLLLGLLVGLRQAPAAQAQATEGRAGDVIALTATVNNNSILYLVDVSREVILVYGYQDTGLTANRDFRNGAFEFLAGRLYRWDALLATKREYAIRGVRTLRGLRPLGPGSSEEEFKQIGK